MTIFSTASGQAVGDGCGGGETLGRGATPEASQRAAMKPCNSNSERHLQGDLLREFEERWFALEQQTTAWPTV